MPQKTPRKKIQPKRVAAPYLAQRKAFAAQFKSAVRDQVRLRRAALRQVKRWEYFSAPAKNLNPGYFFMEHDLGGAFLGVRPGRKLSGRPALKGKMVRHGLDQNGTLHVIEHADGSEEFWQYFDDRIEAVFYEKGQPPSLQTLWPRTGRPEALVFYNKWVMTLRVYGYDAQGALEHIVEAEQFHNQSSSRFEVREAWPEWKKKFAVQIGAAAPARKLKNSVPVLDLQKELPEIVALIEKTVQQFAERQKKSSGSRKIQAVSGIGIQFRHYDHEAMPEFLISFDTRGSFEDDGTWTHQFVAAFKRPGWQKYCAAERKADGNEMLMDVHGKKHWIDIRSEPLRWFGGLLGKALLSTAKKPAFKALQKSKRCKMLVHDVDFGFCWKR